MAAIVLIRAVDAVWFHKNLSGKNFNGGYAIRRYITGTLITAVMWSIYSVGMLQYSNTIELASNIIIVSALAGGGASILAAHKSASIAFSTIILIPYSLALVMSFEDYQFLLGVLGLCFGTVMILTSNKSANFTRQALWFKNENEVLVHHMEDQVEQRTQQIYELSNLDPLTGLLNRTAFLDFLATKLEESHSSQQPLALLFIDLDKFKKINDTVGHEIGDKVLSQTALRLKEFCSGEQLLCRWGGDEFIMVLPNTERTPATKLSDDIIKELSKPYSFNESRQSISATIGIAMYPEHSRDASMLIRLADAAMYYQKDQLSSKAFVFSEQLGKQITREHRLKAGLAQALKKQELRLVFQPIIDSETGSAIAFEALLRWRFGRENIAPTEFIGIAEQYGMIHQIGAWVLNEACKAASSWDRSKNLVVNVNVSVIQLQDDHFIDIVRSALKHHKLPAEFLNIEITESVLASDKEILSYRVDQLKSMGVKVSIDDFGTGYSSLSVIQDLAIDIVKIDRTFIDSLDTKGLPIVKAIMDIASSLNYIVIAEGVENIQQAQRLLSLGVNSQQGFYFAKPMEFNQVDGFLAYQTSTAIMPAPTQIKH